MSEKLLTGMAAAFFRAQDDSNPDYAAPIDIKAMQEALMWLSENVTQEMLDAADYEICSGDSFVTKEVIASALRKAAGK